MAKSIKANLHRALDDNYCYLGFYLPDGYRATLNFCWDDFRRVCPGLCKGLRCGKDRELRLTQTPNGIKLVRRHKGGG